MIFISRGRLRKTTRLPQMIASPTSSQGREGGAAPPVPEEGVGAVLRGWRVLLRGCAGVFDIPRLHRIEAEEETFCLELRRSDPRPCRGELRQAGGACSPCASTTALSSVSSRGSRCSGGAGSATRRSIYPASSSGGCSRGASARGMLLWKGGPPFEFLGIVSRGLIRIEHAFGEDHRGDGCCFGVAEVLHDPPQKPTASLACPRRRLSSCWIVPRFSLCVGRHPSQTRWRRCAVQRGRRIAACCVMWCGHSGGCSVS